MRPCSPLAGQLRDNRPPLLDGSNSTRQLNVIVNICLALASEHLERKWNSRRLTQLQGISEADLAYDCIADLFQQDDAGRLVQLEAYFSSIRNECTDGEELLVYLRRLVYSRVNQAIFRMYEDIDPTLSRILRNIKIAVQKLGQFEEIDRFGENCLAPLLCDKLQHLQPVNEQVIEQHLSSVCIGIESIPQMLAGLALYLREQDEHSRVVPFMVVARSIESVYTIRHRPLLEAAQVEAEFEIHDTTAIVKSACRKVRHEMFARYVEKHKINEELFDHYFEIIERNLLLRFVELDGHDKAYFDLLKSRLPDLTKGQYRAQHRAKLEYLGALTYKRAMKELKGTWRSDHE